MTSEKEKDETDALGFGFLKGILKPSKDLQIEDLDDEEVPNKEVTMHSNLYFFRKPAGHGSLNRSPE